jgi:hypothetical protein
MQPPRAHMGLAVAFMAIMIAYSAATGASDAGGGSGAAAFDCTQSCSFEVNPACGADGEWYHNACLATCSGGVALASDALLCQGEERAGCMQLYDNRPGPAGPAWRAQPRNQPPGPHQRPGPLRRLKHAFLPPPCPTPPHPPLRPRPPPQGTPCPSGTTAPARAALSRPAAPRAPSPATWSRGSCLRASATSAASASPMNSARSPSRPPASRRPRRTARVTGSPRRCGARPRATCTLAGALAMPLLARVLNTAIRIMRGILSGAGPSGEAIRYGAWMLHVARGGPARVHSLK